MDLYQVCSNDAPPPPPRVKTGTSLEATVKNIGIKKEKIEIPFLCNWKVSSFDIWYIASPCGPLPNCSYDASGVKTGPSSGVTS